MGNKNLKRSYIHDILLIPHPPKCLTPPTPRVGGGGGKGWWGTWGWGGGVGHWGGGVLEEYRVYMHIYTHVGNRITVRKKKGNSHIPSHIQPF